MPFKSDSHASLRQARFAILLTAAVGVALLLPQPQAMAGEVHFDPDSPAGKEYALPLDRARDEAAGTAQSDGPAGESSPLFGEGVSGSGGGGAAGEGSTPGANPATEGSQSSKDQGAAATRRGKAAIAAAIARSEDADGYGLPSAILWIAAIIALGGLAGLALRGFQRPRPT